jgi:hypothetical protein
VVAGHFHLTRLVPLLLLGIASALCVIWLVVRGRRTVTDACCGRCGYLVAGLPGSVCPECGSDLFAVGIRMPSERPAMPRPLRAVLFTLVFAAIVWLILPIIMPILPSWYSGASQVEMAYPRSQNYHSVSALASGEGWSPAVKFDHVDLILAPRYEEPRTLRIDLRPGESATPVELSRQPEQSITLRDIRDLTPALVGKWMVMFAGPDSPELRDEAESISAETIKLVSSDLQVQQRSVQRTPFDALNFRQWPAVPAVSWRVTAVVVVAIALMWIIGLVRVVRPGVRACPQEINHA